MTKPAGSVLQRSLPKLILFAALFFVSGSAGLIYEIVWERLLELYFGVTITAITLIVSAYMGGLGLGSLFGGIVSQRLKSGLFMYGTIEMAIGLFGLASPGLIVWIGRATAGSPYAVVFSLSFAFLLIPTFLMGMTLPLLTRAFVDRVNRSGYVIGLLYGINTLGAAFGALLAGYLLISWSGFNGACKVAFVLNVLVGLCAILINRNYRGFQQTPEKTPPAAKGHVLWKYRTILFASFLIGFIGLGYEMLWMRVLLIVNKSTVYGFPTILAVFLTGLALGGYYWGRRADQANDLTGLFCKVELAVGIMAAISFLIIWYGMSLPAIRAWLSENFSLFQQPASPFVEVSAGVAFSKHAFLYSMLHYFLPILLVVFPTSLVMGGGLPMLDRIAIDSPDVAGRRVGDVHLANILGSVFGTLTISLVFLPSIGSEITLKMLLLLSLVFPILYLTSLKERKSGRSRPFLLLSAATLFSLLVLPGKGRLYARLYTIATGSSAYIQETAESVLAITSDQAGNRDFWIGGEINSYFPSNANWESQAMACAGATQPKHILVIGMGGGHTANLFTKIPGVESIDIVELIPALGSFVSDQIPTARSVLADPRVHYIADDGRRYLYAHPKEEYDLISIDPLRSYTSGHNNLYSIQALRLYSQHLNPGGIFCQWVDEQHILAFTTANVFPFVDHFSNFVVASNTPIHYSVQRMESTKAFFLATYTIPMSQQTQANFDAPHILHKFSRDQEQILEDEIGAPVLTDNNPWLEYYLFHPPILTVEKRNPGSAFLSRVLGCDAVCARTIQSGGP